MAADPFQFRVLANNDQLSVHLLAPAGLLASAIFFEFQPSIVEIDNAGELIISAVFRRRILLVYFFRSFRV